MAAACTIEDSSPWGDCFWFPAFCSAGLAYVFTGLIEAFGSVFSGIFSGTAAIGSVIIGVVLGLIGYRMLRDRKARKAAEAEKA